jgi:hypothetical protein
MLSREFTSEFTQRTWLARAAQSFIETAYWRR